MIVFLGGGGAGLSALVNIFFEIGFEDIVVVDKYKSEISEKLEQKGIKVIIGDDVYNFSDDDIIIYSDAVTSSKDFQKIKNNTKFTYFQFVGEISKRFQTVSIAGTHGKSSTTSIALSTGKKLGFEQLGLGIVGAFVPDLGNRNYFVNSKYKSEIKTIFEKILNPKGARPSKLFKKLYFFIEADEFNRHFLLLDSYISLITKVDHDHIDVYPTEKEYLKAFELFIEKTRYKAYTNDKYFYKKIENNKLENIEEYEDIKFDYIFGEHMQKNASLVLILFILLGYKKEEILQAIKEFKGLWRRQEYLGKIKNIEIYTDYAHHPIEIEATYRSFRKHFKNKKLIAIFQPHQLFRFTSYESDFLDSLKHFDEIYIYDIYSVREEELIKKLIEKKNFNVSNSKDAIKKIGEEIANKLNGKYIQHFDTLISEIENKDAIGIVMSAGDLDYKIRNYII